MKKILLMLFFTCACVNTQAQVNIITTICGDDTAGYSGDNGLAKNARLSHPEDICLDKDGNILIADAANNRIRKINLITGIITTIAGNDTAGFSGDEGLASIAKLNSPEGVITDANGDIYIADAANQRIRKITISTGIITTIAGNGTIGSSGDGGAATNAEMWGPSGVYVDKYKNIYFADNLNNKVRKVEMATGIITTIAGTRSIGYAGDHGPAIDAELSGPGDVSLDSSGNIVFTDTYNSAIRKINATTGIITTIAGFGTYGYSGDSGPATAAYLNEPNGIFIDKQNNIFIGEYGNGVIRRIDGTTQIITTVAGNGTYGYSGDDGPATNAQLMPDAAWVDDFGTMYIADYDNHAIRKVYNPTLGVTSPRPSPKERVTLLPNPARDEVTVEGAAGSEVSIYNMAGQEVYQSKILSDKQTFNIACISPGVYEVQIINSLDGLWVTRKLVIAQ